MNETTGDPEGLDEKITALEDTQRTIKRETIAIALKCGVASSAVIELSKKSRTINLSKFVSSNNI